MSRTARREGRGGLPKASEAIADDAEASGQLTSSTSQTTAHIPLSNPHAGYSAPADRIKVRADRRTAFVDATA